MIKAGVMINDLGASQLAFSLTTSLNALTVEYGHVDVIVYYENWAKVLVPPRFAMMMEREIWGLDGIAFATDLKTAQRLLKCPGPTKKYFYVWNLEWTMLSGHNYEAVSQIYNNPNIELIARSDSHARLITNLWKKPAFVMDDWDKEVMKEILK